MNAHYMITITAAALLSAALLGPARAAEDIGLPDAVRTFKGQSERAEGRLLLAYGRLYNELQVLGLTRPQVRRVAEMLQEIEQEKYTMGWFDGIAELVETTLDPFCDARTQP